MSEVPSNTPSTSDVIKSVLATRHTEIEVEHILTITEPLFDDDRKFRTIPLEHHEYARTIHALSSAFGMPGAMRLWTPVLSHTPRITRPQYITLRAWQEHEIAVRDSYRQAVMSSCSNNAFAMFASTLPQGTSPLLPTGQALPADVEYKRNLAALACLRENANPSPDAVRTAIVATYLDLEMHGDKEIASRLRPLANIAACKAIPYGPRKVESDERDHNFIFFLTDAIDSI